MSGEQPRAPSMRPRSICNLIGTAASGMQVSAAPRFRWPPDVVQPAPSSRSDGQIRHGCSETFTATQRLYPLARVVSAWHEECFASGSDRQSSHPHHVKKFRNARHAGPLRQFSSQALAESADISPEHTEPEHTELCLAFSERPCVYRKAFAGRDRYWRGPRADCCRARLPSSKRFLLQRASSDGRGRVCQNSDPATGAYARPKSAGDCCPSGRPETRWRLVVLTLT
jgi:hypothetical protein